MFFQIAVGVLMFSDYVYHRWTENDDAAAARGKPGEMSVPRTMEGAPLPLIYGTFRVQSPVLAWVGNWFTEPLSGRFKYFLDYLWMVGVPFNGGTASLVAIYAGNINVPLLLRDTSVDPAAWNHPGRTRYLAHNATEVFGGDGKGGGIQGEVAFFDGRSTQRLSDGINHGDFTIDYTEVQAYLTGDRPAPGDPNTVYSSLDASLIPGYRNQALCFLYSWGGSESPTILAYSFVVRALSTGSASDLGNSLADDADPAAVIYDLLTSPWGKLALPTSKIDLVSFAAASTTLVSENHGYSMAVETTTDATQIIGDILRQIDGVMYEEPTTGKMELHLVRNDYNLADLTDINPDNAILTEYSVQAWSETFNQVRVMFTDRANAYAEGVATGQNGANVMNQGGKLRSTDIRFAGCCERALAQRLASRELAATTRPLAKATVVVDRSFYLARPGQVFTLTWPELGISGMVMRVARVDLGQLHKGEITLNLMRDVFDAAQGAFPI